jgi:hypothetical protein
MGMSAQTMPGICTKIIGTPTLASIDVIGVAAA